MNKPTLYLNGSPLALGKRIGKGGEGEVYLANNLPKTAIKIYTGTRNKDREAKVQAMVQHALADKTNLVAFPKDVVTSKDGVIAGFTMNIIDGHRPLHELYGPKSRKIYYPKADFRFLVRTALNVARAVGQVHQSTCIIGDVNHSGILVSDAATVAMIDADSFQFEADGRKFPCLVGVPDFTPPELQGASLHGIVRTKYHDNFGLAVAIFQLLFMGRHPYAGKQAGADLTLEQVIGRNGFAYSRIRKTGISPPNFVANLDDFPPEIGDAFERAFGLKPEQRPSAEDWVGALKYLEGRLSHCSANPLHYFPSHSKQCPWCRMENSIGAILFISPLINIALSTKEYASFNIDRVWAEIENIALPNIQNPQPRLPHLVLKQPSVDAQKAKKNLGFGKLKGIATIIAAAIAWIAFPQVFWIWCWIIYWGWSQCKSSPNHESWKSEFIKVCSTYENAVSEWQRNLGINRLYEIKNGLKSAADEFRLLSQRKSQELGKLKTERRNQQLNVYLDKFLIRHASIPGISHGKAVTLESFGIESAADINRYDILSIPGFGEKTADKLLNWRAQYERHFVYNTAPTHADTQAQIKIENEFAAKAKILINRLSTGGAELRQVLTGVQTRLNTENAQLSTLAAAKAQISADLEFLGIAKPYVAHRSTQTINIQTVTSTPTPAQLMTGSNVQCPKCNSTMVRRTAKRGRNRGGSFWGCSRYPRCNGTRP